MVHISRRSAVGLSLQAGMFAAIGGPFAVADSQPAGGGDGKAQAEPATPWPGFPRQNFEWAREVVGASHGDEAKVRQLVTEHPALANAAWDWGFGDWETALGAAAHTGRRSIAEFLIAQGARLDLFAAAMLGYVDVVKACIEASPGIQRTRGPHGIHLLAHAKAGGEAAKPVVEYLEAVGGAGDAVATEPLTAQQRERFVGDFVYGPGTDDRLRTFVQNETLWLERPGHPRRGLNYLGNQEFSPVGALGVRIRFELDVKPRRLTVIDGKMVITAAEQ